jgi:hypothetical protein
MWRGRGAGRAWNCEFPEDLFYAWGGMPVREIVETLGAQQGLRSRRRGRASQGTSLLRLLPQLQAVPEVLEVIELNYWARPVAHGRGVRQQPRVGDEVADDSAGTAGLLASPRTVRRRWCARRIQPYTKPKPDAEPFLVRGDQRLGVAPAARIAWCSRTPRWASRQRPQVLAGMASVKILCSRGNGSCFPRRYFVNSLRIDGVAHGFVAGVAGVQVVAVVVGGQEDRGVAGSAWPCRSR